MTITEEQVIAGNKLIAGFMDFQYDRRLFDKQMLTIEDCRYHTSWDWLMPVVEAIEKVSSEKPYYRVTSVIIQSNKCTISICTLLNGIGSEFYTIEKEGTSKLQAIWLAALEFIKWYNQQSK